MDTKVLITGASPDVINHNSVMRNYVTEGFCALLSSNNVRNVPLQFSVSALKHNPVDIVLVFGSCMPDNCDYGALRAECDRSGAKLVFWLHDDPYEQDFNFKIVKYADVIFSNDKWATQFYDHSHCYHLPMAASESAHFRSVTQYWEMDLFFCGVGFENRIRLLRDLKPLLNQIKTKVVGDAWPKDLVFANNQRINNAELPNQINNSKFILNLGRHYNLGNDRYKLDPSTPGPRTFETAMAGATQLYFVESLEIEEYYEPDKEILLFDGYKDLSRIFEMYLDEPSAISEISKAAQKRTLSEHTYKHRARKILSKLCSLS